MNARTALRNRPVKQEWSFHRVLNIASMACLAVLTAALLLRPGQIWAGGVVTNCTEPSLRSAMAGGGTVTFACDGIITLTNTITVSNNTALDGAGRQITISGGNTVRVFCVNSNVTFTVANATITQGASQCGAGILNLYGTVNLLSVAFLTNATALAWTDFDLPSGMGGAIYNRGGTIHATNCVFTGNYATKSQPGFDWGIGGALFIESGEVVLQHCSFTSNLAIGPAGILTGESEVAAGGQGLGGAVYNNGTLTAESCCFRQNRAVGGNCGTNMAPSGGYAGGLGGHSSGGALVNAGTANLSFCEFTGNATTGGDGGNAWGAYPDPIRKGYPGGTGGSGYGGAVFNGGTLSVRCTLLARNSATGGRAGAGGQGGLLMDWGLCGGLGAMGGPVDGSALYNYGGAIITDSTIVSNHGEGGRGGDGGTGGLGNFWGGQGGDGGDGGFAFGSIGDISGRMSLTNCTIAFNSGVGGAGGTGGPGGNGVPSGQFGVSGMTGLYCGGINAIGAKLMNTLLATNIPGGNCLGFIIDAGHNLNSQYDRSFFTSESSLVNIDARLAPLADNGGPTLTMALLPDSPAIDAGNTAAAPCTDQRGFPRPAGSGADIGACEYGSMLPVLSITRSGPGLHSLLIQGNSNRWFRLLASSNFTDWVPIVTNQISGDGTTLFQETCSPGVDCRFYRVVMP